MLKCLVTVTEDYVEGCGKKTATTEAFAFIKADLIFIQISLKKMFECFSFPSETQTIDCI